MKLFLTYVTSLAILLGGAGFAAYTLVHANMIPAAEANAPVSKPAIVAKSDASDEPVVDINDPTLFDARGQFPAALREAMAKARRDSIRDFATVRAEYIKAAKEKKTAQRKISRPSRVPAEPPQGYQEAHRTYDEPARRQESWNNGGFGFGF